MFQIKKAERKNVKLRIGMFGPSGAGKTMSALKFAKGLCGDWSAITVLDTENDSASLYSHLGDYSVVPFNEPFSPQRYIQAIKFIADNTDTKVLVIDSVSHEWDGKGGCLEIVNSLGGQFHHWSKVTPQHNAFIDAITHAPFHVICCARSKIDYAIDKDDRGKTTVQKVGLKSVTREGFDYELTCSFNINHSHYALIDKDRTNLFANTNPFVIDESIGEKVRDWNESGAEVKDDWEAKLRALIDKITNGGTHEKAVAFVKDFWGCEDIGLAIKEMNESGIAQEKYEELKKQLEALKAKK